MEMNIIDDFSALRMNTNTLKPRKPAWIRWGGVALGLTAAVMLGLLLKNVLVSDAPLKKPTIRQVTLLKLQPPPPPELKPPEPEVKQEVVTPEPEQTPQPQQDDAPPQGEALGLDTAGTGDGDGFGLVAKQGGADLIGSGNGSPWASYDWMVNEAVNAAFQKALLKEKELKEKSYKVVVKLWIGADNQITKMVLVDTTGNPQVDALLKQVLVGISLRDKPPENMPQPLKVRVTSRA